MIKVRFRPNEVEAVQFTEQMLKDRLFFGVLLPPCMRLAGASFRADRQEIGHFQVYVQTPDGTTALQYGDWVVNNDTVVDNETFEKTFERV